MIDRAGLIAIPGTSVDGDRMNGVRGGKMRIGPISPEHHFSTEADEMVDLIFQDPGKDQVRAFWVLCGEVVYLMLEGRDVSAYPRSEDGYEMDEDDVFDLLAELGTDMRISIKGSHSLDGNKEFHCRYSLGDECVIRSVDILGQDARAQSRAYA